MKPNQTYEYWIITIGFGILVGSMAFISIEVALGMIASIIAAVAIIIKQQSK